MALHRGDLVVEPLQCVVDQAYLYAAAGLIAKRFLWRVLPEPLLAPQSNKRRSRHVMARVDPDHVIGQRLVAAYARGETPGSTSTTAASTTTSAHTRANHDRSPSDREATDSSNSAIRKLSRRNVGFRAGSRPARRAGLLSAGAPAYLEPERAAAEEEAWPVLRRPLTKNRMTFSSAPGGRRVGAASPMRASRLGDQRHKTRHWLRGWFRDPRRVRQPCPSERTDPTGPPSGAEAVHYNWKFANRSRGRDHRRRTGMVRADDRNRAGVVRAVTASPATVIVRGGRVEQAP